MSLIGKLIDVILHLDKYLTVIIQNYGAWTYALIFIVIFCETGLVVTPFLPGDSIIFATGALAAIGSLNFVPLFLVFYAAAVIGDTVNYEIGKKIGKGLEDKENVKFINKEYLAKAHKFYQKHGSLTIVIGRFIPIIRTFVPFVAGIGEMKYLNFITYNLIGGFLWVALFLSGGYFFGNIAFVKNHFSVVVIAIILISLVPAVIAFLSEKKKSGDKETDILDREAR